MILIIGLIWLLLGVVTMATIWLAYRLKPNKTIIIVSLPWILIWPMMIYYEILDSRKLKQWVAEGRFRLVVSLLMMITVIIISLQVWKPR